MVREKDRGAWKSLILLKQYVLDKYLNDEVIRFTRFHPPAIVERHGRRRWPAVRNVSPCNEHITTDCLLPRHDICREGLGDMAQETCLALRLSDKHFIDDRKIEDATSDIRFHETRLDEKGRKPQTACAKLRK